MSTPVRRQRPRRQFRGRGRAAQHTGNTVVGFLLDGHGACVTTVDMERSKSMKLDDVLAASPDGAFTIDSDGKIVFWNLAAEKILG